MTQKQTGGIGSHNVQIGTLVVGPSVEDVKFIAKELFEENFSKLVSVAEDVAAARAAELRDEIAAALANGEGSSSAFSQVEKQVALFEAQKAYALSGDEDLKLALKKSVLSLSAEPERSPKAIVLQEAIKSLQAINSDMLRVISIIFLVKHVKLGGRNIEEVVQRYLNETGIKRGNINLSRNITGYLEYAGISRSLLNKSIYKSLSEYKHYALVEAHSLEWWVEKFKPEDVPSESLFLRDVEPDRFAIAANDLKDFANKSRSWSPHQADVGRACFQAMSEAEFKVYVSKISDDAAYLMEKWDELHLGYTTLTSVGIALAHTSVSARSQIPEVDDWI